MFISFQIEDLFCLDFSEYFFTVIFTIDLAFAFFRNGIPAMLTSLWSILMAIVVVGSIFDLFSERFFGFFFGFRYLRYLRLLELCNLYKKTKPFFSAARFCTLQMGGLYISLLAVYFVISCGAALIGIQIFEKTLTTRFDDFDAASLSVFDGIAEGKLISDWLSQQSFKPRNSTESASLEIHPRFSLAMYFLLLQVLKCMLIFIILLAI